MAKRTRAKESIPPSVGLDNTGPSEDSVNTRDGEVVFSSDTTQHRDDDTCTSSKRNGKL